MSERWKPKHGDKYWIVDTYCCQEVRATNWLNDTDNANYKCGNCFKTKKEAKAAAEKVKELLLSLHEQVTDCNQLPKLTVEVFNHPECPKWARYAAVDESGNAYWYASLPKNEIYALTHQCVWHNESKNFEMIPGKFDASDWKNSLIERPSKNRPKLTAEVFDRPDCPKWAKYAVVDCDGYAWWYKDVPTRSAGGKWFCDDTYWKGTHGIWDASDWQNSLLERPSKDLPDWCKVGEWCYCKDDDGNDKYFKITETKGEYLYGNDWDIAVSFTKPARLRPYNADELRGLVGKVVTNEEGNDYLCTVFNRATDNSVAVVDIDTWVCAEYMLEHGYTINGKPCGVLEHFEKGEWVE